MADIADGYPSKSIQLSVSSNRPDGNAGHRPPPRRSSAAPGRTRKNEHSSRKTEGHKNEEDLKNPKSNNQEEIIALFRKIQTSIAKESASTDDEHSHKDELGTESLLETLRESKKQVKGNFLIVSSDAAFVGNLECVLQELKSINITFITYKKGKNLNNNK